MKGRVDMKNIERRVRKAEDLVGIDDKDVPVMIICLEHGDAAPRFDDPVEEWLIYGKAYAEARRTGAPFIVVEPDPWNEYEMRHGLEPGTLSKHPLKGEVPFEELLAQATGEMADGGPKQTKLDETERSE
jgi:hypothetical protein